MWLTKLTPAQKRQICKALKDKGKTLTMLGAEMDPPVTRQAVSKTLIQPSRYSRIWQHIVNTIGEKESDLILNKPDNVSHPQ